MGKSTAKQTTTTIRIINNNKEIEYFKLHNHMYVLVDLVFVIKRNWELRAPAIPHGFLGLAISISITVLETTDLVYADLILFTSLFYLRGRRNPHLNPLPDPFSRFPPISNREEPADGLRMRVRGFPTNQCEIEYSQNGVRDETSASFSEFSYWSKQNLRLFCSAKT